MKNNSSPGYLGVRNHLNTRNMGLKPHQSEGALKNQKSKSPPKRVRFQERMKRLRAKRATQQTGNAILDISDDSDRSGLGAVPKVINARVTDLDATDESSQASVKANFSKNGSNLGKDQIGNFGQKNSFEAKNESSGGHGLNLMQQHQAGMAQTSKAKEFNPNQRLHKTPKSQKTSSNHPKNTFQASNAVLDHPNPHQKGQNRNFQKPQNSTQKQQINSHRDQINLSDIKNHTTLTLNQLQRAQEGLQSPRFSNPAQTRYHNKGRARGLPSLLETEERGEDFNPSQSVAMPKGSSFLKSSLKKKIYTGSSGYSNSNGGAKGAGDGPGGLLDGRQGSRKRFVTYNSGVNVGANNCPETHYFEDLYGDEENGTMFETEYVFGKDQSLIQSNSQDNQKNPKNRNFGGNDMRMKHAGPIETGIGKNRVIIMMPTAHNFDSEENTLPALGAEDFSEYGEGGYQTVQNRQRYPQNDQKTPENELIRSNSRGEQTFCGVPTNRNFGRQGMRRAPQNPIFDTPLSSIEKKGGLNELSQNEESLIRRVNLMNKTENLSRGAAREGSVGQEGSRNGQETRRKGLMGPSRGGSQKLVFSSLEAGNQVYSASAWQSGANYAPKPPNAVENEAGGDETGQLDRSDFPLKLKEITIQRDVEGYNQDSGNPFTSWIPGYVSGSPQNGQNPQNQFSGYESGEGQEYASGTATSTVSIESGLSKLSEVFEEHENRYLLKVNLFYFLEILAATKSTRD